MANIKRANTSGITKSGVAIPDVPDAPTIGAATNVGTSQAYNNGSATVAFTAAATGGTPTSYTATSTPGSFTASGAGSPLTVTGLQSATSYTFAVTGTNTTATGAASAASSSITATTIPATPSAPTPTNVGTSRAYNNGAASVAFTAPATGGAAISSYTVTSSPGSFTGTGSSSPITVAGLASATSYTFTMTATNANGTTAASSASASVTATTIPQAPTIGTATGGSASASVTFTAGATGGSAITGYTVTSSPGSITGTGASSPITVSGLTNGTAYTFTVTATNANGTSTASSASNSVTPVAPTYYAIQTDINNASGYSGGSIVKKHLAPSGRDSNSVIFFDREGAGILPGVVSVSPAGVLVSSKAVGNGLSSNSAIQDVVIDSSGNYWINGSTHLQKMNSSLVWQSAVNFGGTWAGKGMAIDSSNNIYLTGNDGTNTYFMKLNSSGNAITWQRKINFYWQPSSIAVDSSGNVFGVSSQAGYKGWLGKWNSSGTLQWQRQFSPASGAHGLTGVQVDSSGNVYVTGYSNSGDRVFAKYNTSGAIQWQKSTNSANTMLVIDSSDNIYVVGTGVQTLNYVKYDTAGTASVVRTFNYLDMVPGGNGLSSFPRVSVTADGSTLYIPGILDNGSRNYGFTWKYPTNGSVTGSKLYANNIYSDSAPGSGSWTDAAGSATESAGGLSLSTSTGGSDANYPNTVTLYAQTST
jgi:hypothetical protein